MADYSSLFDDPRGTREEIMQATYRALCEHGYADLSIQDIADNFEKSKSLIYHHYDSKDDLLLDFLGFMLEQFEESIPSEDEENVPKGDADTADEHLDAILDYMFTPSLEDERRDFLRAMSELRAQAAHDDGYSEKISHHDSFLIDSLAEVIDRGIEEGVFRNVDSGEVANFLFTAMSGSMERRVTNQDASVGVIRSQIDEYLQEVLYR
ncbi:MAG: TetR/AcrR family transcriptional regulator [Halobacteria archaeon]|nr:TetR/AcrR family transcriptional regulator [Halobacteria archaeon]